MIRTVCQLVRRLWDLLTLPARKAIAGRIDHYLDRHLQSWFDRTQQTRADQQRVIEEMILAADAMICELSRLQGQIQALEHAVSQRSDADRAPRQHRGAA